MGYTCTKIEFCLHFFFNSMSGSPLDSKLFFCLCYHNNTTSIVDPRTFVYRSDLYKGNANTHKKRCCVCGVGCSCIDRRYLEKSTHFELRRERSLRWRGCCGWGGGRTWWRRIDGSISWHCKVFRRLRNAVGGELQLGGVCLVVVVTKMSNVCLSLAL